MATVFPDTGKAILTNRIKGSGSEPNFVAWGTGAGTANEADTTLFTEAAETRVAGTSTREETTAPDDTYQVIGTIISGSAQSITNAGLFDAISSGNLFVKGNFASIALEQNDSIQFTIKVVFT